MNTPRIEPGKRDEIEVTGEMLAAGEQELALNFDVGALVCAVTAVELRAVYIAMRRLEPEDRARVRREKHPVQRSLVTNET